MNSKQIPHYGVVHSVQELGALARAHRKARGLTLEQTAGIGGTGIRFLSELERGKPTAQLGKALEALRLLGLEVLIVPRGEADRLQRAISAGERSADD